MKKIIWSTAIVAILGSILVAYLYWPKQSNPIPVVVQTTPVTPQPSVFQVVETPPAEPALPLLANSDKLIIDALSELIDNPSLMKFFITERLIHRIVATVDNLPGSDLPVQVMPLRRAPGKFITTVREENLIISPKNAARYTTYVKIADALDTQKLVALYVQFYPLFQQAYEEQGYPKKYFNDRLIVVIDNLLAAPDSEEPVSLVQPKVFYLFADTDLEQRSIGQRILMRTGRRNENLFKKKLYEIKQELKLHMHEQKVDPVG